MADHYLSLTCMRREELTPSFTPTSWTSSNTAVTVTNGWISTKSSKGTATITATDGVNTETWEITLVPWSANRFRLELDQTFDQEYIMTYDSDTDTIYYSIRGNDNKDLYASTDGMQTGVKVSTLPYGQIITPMIITPTGYFIQTTYSIKFSKDLSSWVTLGSPTYTVLKPGMDYYYDSANSRTILYVGEYTTDTSYECNVYKCIVNDGDDGTNKVWSTVLTFTSRDTYTEPTCWHIHVVETDKTNGDVYVCTGDNNSECSIRKSTDGGDTWSVLGVGTEDYRTLSLWFTDDYMYWAMDSSFVQHIYRVPKGATDLTAKEDVATLNVGSMWYHLWIKDDNGDDIILLASSAEGLRQDDHARLWYIKENTDGTVDVEEALLIPRTSTDDYYIYKQFEPYIQDADGYIYGNNRTGVTATTLTQKYHLVRRGQQLLYEFVEPVTYVDSVFS